MIVINNRITPLDGMIISAIKDIHAEKVVLKNIAFDRVVAIEDMHGNMFAKQSKIIRCKDCKYRGGLSGFYCDIVEKAVGVDSFCSWAERRTDE